jgi:hypothetical protein
MNNSLSPFSVPVRLWNSPKKGFVQNFRVPETYRRYLRNLGLQLRQIRGDALFVTMPIQIGKFSLPPRFAFPLLRAVDQWAVKYVPWLAYEVWFMATKAEDGSCAS